MGGWEPPASLEDQESFREVVAFDLGLEGEVRLW